MQFDLLLAFCDIAAITTKYCGIGFTMFAVTLMLILTFFIYCKCYNLRTFPYGIENNEVEKIINSYVKPLSEKFPHHELEVKIEFHGSALEQSNTRRRLYVYKSPKAHHLRNGPERTMADPPALPSQILPASRMSSTTAALHHTAILVPQDKLTEHPVPVPRTETTTRRRPVYKEELDKAIEDLEKKLSQTTKQTPTQTFGQQGQIVISNPNPVHVNDKNLDKIIDLLKKGIQFQKHVPSPFDEKLEWVQVKIPKN